MHIRGILQVFMTTMSSHTSCDSDSGSMNLHSIPLHTVNTKGHQTTIMIPSIGLGTYKFKKGSGMAEQAVLDALRLGYRSIDTAFIYS